MQKVLNIVFIMIILAIASITPLNRALLDINIFSPVVETPEVPEKIVERIDFIGIEGIKLAGGTSGLPDSSQDYWTDVNPDTHLLRFIRTGESFALTFLFVSNTGEFESEFPALAIRIGAEETIALPVSREKMTISGSAATFVLDREHLDERLKDGYNQVTLVGNGRDLGFFVISKNAEISGDFMKYEAGIPEDMKVIKMYFPDAAGEDLVPVSRIYPKYFYDYIQLFESFYRGAKPGYGLAENPAVPYTNSYWISNQETRIDYRSAALQNVKNRELMYRAIGYTFAQLGNLKKTNVYVDGVLDMSFETPKAPFHYGFKRGEGNLLILEKPSDLTSPSAHISAFITEMYEKGVLPPHCRLINCENKEGVLHIDISHYEDMENAKVFEPLLRLTAYSLEGIAGLRLNGDALLPIGAFNIEQP